MWLDTIMMPHPTMITENQMEGRRRLSTTLEGTCVSHLRYIPSPRRKLVETCLEESVRCEEYRYAGEILVISDMKVLLHVVQLSGKRVS